MKTGDIEKAARELGKMLGRSEKEIQEDIAGRLERARTVTPKPVRQKAPAMRDLLRRL